MLIDTNVVSYFLKKDTRAEVYAPHIKNKTLYISFMTVAELYKWPFKRNWAEQKKQQLLQHLHSYVVLPYDDSLAWTWAELVVKTQNAGTPLSWDDSWIAATALRHNLPLVTHNGKHFAKVPGLNLISENRENV